MRRKSHRRSAARSCCCSGASSCSQTCRCAVSTACRCRNTWTKSAGRPTRRRKFDRAPPCSRGAGLSLPARSRHRLGHHGRAALRRNVAIALLANTLATAAALVVLISIFGPVSGAHFNPAVSCSLRSGERYLQRWSRLCRRTADWSVGRRVGGASDVRSASLRDFRQVARRTGTDVLRIRRDVWPDRHHRGCNPLPASWTAALVASISAPPTGHRFDLLRQSAVTIARAFSNSFAGIAPTRPPDSSARNWLEQSRVTGCLAGCSRRSRRLAKRKRGGWRRPTIIRLAWMAFLAKCTRVGECARKNLVGREPFQKNSTA